MLLGKVNVESTVLARHISSKEEFYEFCDSLIPEEFKHVREICNNQRYHCIQIVRKSTSISWDIKKELIASVMSETRVVGMTDVCIDLSTLSNYIDKRVMEKYYRRYNK